MIASTIGKIIDYVLVEDRDKPESDQTTFLLRTLPRKATAIIQDNLVGYDITGSVIVSRPGTGALVACKLGIDGWRNFPDEEGNQVRAHFITSKLAAGLKSLSPKSLDRLSQDAVTELGGKIMEINGLAGDKTEEETEDELATEDPTETSATASDSSSPPPSPQTTPNSETASSPTSEPVPLARA